MDNNIKFLINEVTNKVDKKLDLELDISEEDRQKILHIVKDVFESKFNEIFW